LEELPGAKFNPVVGKLPVAYLPQRNSGKRDGTLVRSHPEHPVVLPEYCPTRDDTSAVHVLKRVVLFEPQVIYPGLKLHRPVFECRSRLDLAPARVGQNEVLYKQVFDCGQVVRRVPGAPPELQERFDGRALTRFSSSSRQWPVGRVAGGNESVGWNEQSCRGRKYNARRGVEKPTPRMPAQSWIWCHDVVLEY